MAKILPEKLELVKGLYDNGKSAQDVALKLKVPLGAVYYFLRRYKIARRNSKENNALRFKNKQASFSIKDNLSKGENELFVAGVMLYWGEGSKWSGEKIIDFANSDEVMIEIFLKFLRNICRVDEKKFRVYLYCYENQDCDKLMAHWSKFTNIPLRQFTKPYVRQDYRLSKIDKMKHGLVHIRYYDKKLLDLMREWIKDFPLKFKNMGR